MTPTILRLQPADALLLARTIKPHVSVDAVTPVLCGTGISAHEGRIEAVGTDRYTVARIRVPHYERDEHGGEKAKPVEWTLESTTVIVPRAALEWIVANANRYKSGTDVVTIEMEERGTTGKPRTLVTITVADKLSGDRVIAVFTSTVGNYPPVGRLIDQHDAVPMDKLVFNPDLIARTRSGLPRGTAVEYVAGKSEGSRKAGPMLYLPHLGRDDVDLVGLIQPNLDLRP